MFLLALAAVLSLPVPVDAHAPDLRALFSADDFPPYLQGVGLKRTVYTRTTVRSDGTVQGCVAEASSGDPRLDAYTCSLIVKRARLLPARWVDGSAVYAVVRLPVRWTVSDAPPSPQEVLREEVPDLEVSVDHLPKHAHSIVGVSLEIAADEHGKPLACVNWDPPKNDYDRHFPELVPIACHEVMDKLSVSPPVDASGKKIRSIQNVSVHLKTEP